MAEKRVQELLGQMQKTLECSICLEMMNNPVSTGCGHQFCRFCLTEFIDRKRQVPCPLCKKPITKRSLMKREELGDMVEGVRSLISAFQKDTGFLFSPPRGPQTGLLPGTPDSIKAKTTTGQKPAKNVAHSNVRRTKRRQLIDTASTDSPSLIRRGSSPSHNVQKSINGEQDAEIGSSRTLEDVRQQELLKCIQEGTLNADDSSEDNDDVSINKEGNSTSTKLKTRKRNGSKKHQDRNSRNSNISRQKIGKVGSDLTDSGKEIMEMNQSKVVSVSDKVTEKSNAKLKIAESIGKSVNEDIAIEVQENNDNDASDQIEMEVDTDVHILSGTSVAKESESSSGPLFRTPVDPKGLKHSHQRNSLEDQSQVRKKSLRSKDNTDKHLEANEHDSCLKMTQEDLTVKVKDNSRTYCKKDKDLFVKEKKATRKVAEWLKNIPPITDSENVGCDEIRTNQPKEKIQPKRMSKKDVKVREEEEAMGNKIKHLAKQVQDNGKGLLFEIDDFETEPEKRPPNDSKIKSDQENASISIESENSNLDNKNYEEVSEVQVQEVKHVITEPVRRKRIFKSRTNQSDVSSESDSDKALIRNNNQNVPVMKTITEEKNTSNVLGNEIVEIRSQDSELPSSDPYEFKSSQNTPMKVTKKKGKSKNNKQSKALKSKQVSTKVEDGITKRSFEKVWDKDLMPEKTILKTAKQEEIDKLNARLMQAEDYDLLTCTQEAADSIAKENSYLKTAAEDRKNVNSDTNGQKKVRFTEPVISDFIQTGKINIIGYRNAKKELDEVKNKTNIKKEDKAKKGVKIEQKREKDKECPIGLSKDVEDCESDDLSEDYRFQDDSSGTDDLDIEPTQDQFEKPNIEIQTEEIKAKLSQDIDVLQEKVVPETPLIPMNHNPPNTNVIEETPAIFTMPKFNKNLSRPIGKTRKQMKVKTPPLHFKSDAVPETPEIVNIDKHHETHGSVGRKKEEFESEDVLEEEISQGNKIPVDAKDVEQLSKTNSEVRSKILGESDETVSPDTDFTEVQVTNTDKVEKIEHMQVDNDLEDLAEKPQGLVDSESSLTQNSESILQTKTVPNKIGSTIDDKNDEAKEAVVRRTNFEGHNKMNMDIEGDCDCPVASIESMTNTKTKKKRKSFMLDEAEESLDFGSLSACEPTSVSEYSESVSKAKRQRVNRLKRSPKTTGKIQDVQKCQSQEKNSGISSSVEIIPDTMTLQSGNKSFTPIKSSNADRIQEKKDSENIDEDTCQVITLSSESGSFASVQEGLKSEGKESNLEKIGTEIEPEPRNLGVTESTDVIAETKIGEIENTAELEIKENVDYSIKGTKNNLISEKVDISDYSESPKSRKKRKSGQLGRTSSGQDSQSSIDKVRHFSGILASPQDSLILSGVKGSPEDIFKIDSEMPSVDLSPNGDIVEEDQNSPSLDLGTLMMEEPHSDYVNSVKRKSIDELDLNDKTDNDLINNDQRERSDSQGHSSEKLVNPCSRNKETELNINSSSDNVERGGKVSGVRGFAKRKRKSAIGQSPLPSSRSENSAIDETPLSYNSVKYKSPVVKFSSPKLVKASQSEIIDTDILNKVGDDTKFIHSSPCETTKSKGIKDSRVKVKERNTPVKTFGDINSSKYSPKLLKNRKEKGESNESKFSVEVIELRNDDDDNDDCLLSPDDLPDIDNDCVKVNKDENVDHIMGHQEHVKITKKAKVSPKLILSSPDKENNVVIKGKKNQDTPKRIEDEEEYNTVIPETMSVDDDDDVGAGVDVNSPTKGHDKLTGKTLDIDEKECDYNSRTEKETYAKNDFGDVVENSISSSSSSEFRIDSSDEKSIENEALNEISKFNEIVQNSLDINTLTDSKDMKNNMITQNKGSNCKDLRKKNSIEIDENESFERSRALKEGKLKKAQDNLKNIVDKNVVDIENMYSTRLDSSPESCVELDVNEESVPVILESDIDDEVDESVKDDVECIDDKQDINVDREGETEKEMADDDSDDDSDDDIRIKSGRKRAILSDSSSEEEEEESRHMNYTSSSAFSSQSENLTTQERQSLEKEVERMAREMEAMKEQLRKSKEMNKTKKPDKKSVKIDDSDDEVPVIEASDSENGDEDLFLSPPAINPGDLELDDEETLDPAAVQESQNHDEATDQVEESLCQESFTVPESDPSQVSQSVLQKPNLSNMSHPVIPESDLSKVTRPVLSDLDTNIIPAPKSDPTRHVGIVVTGLNVKQIQQTKKLAALTSAKFFTKFNDSVTHVIVKPADEDDTVCDRTLKFFQGIARKCWIVNFFWVVDSREVGQLLPEGPYEIQGDTTFNQSHFGPKKSRLSKDDKLFQKFQFSLIGDNTYLSKDSMCDLIKTCGGEVMDIVKLSKGKRTQFVISCTDIDDDEEDVQSIVKHAREMYKKHGIVTLTREWILDSLTLYKIQPVQDYLVTDLPNLKLPII